jgi:hypothetical protein
VLLSGADILLSTCVTWAVHYGIPAAGSVVAYNARATARPSYARGGADQRAAVVLRVRAKRKAPLRVVIQVGSGVPAERRAVPSPSSR